MLAVVDSFGKGQDVLKFRSSLIMRLPTAAARLWKAVLIVWASPYSLMGLSVGCCGMLCGARARLREGAIEFYGGGVHWFISHLPTDVCVEAITLGHVILGRTESVLIAAGDHERVHIRQFELWGPAMGPAYLLASGWMWCLGRDAYRDNPFEKEAYATTWRRHD